MPYNSTLNHPKCYVHMENNNLVWHIKFGERLYYIVDQGAIFKAWLVWFSVSSDDPMGTGTGQNWIQVGGRLKYLAVPLDTSEIECWGVNADDEIYVRPTGISHPSTNKCILTFKWLLNDSSRW